LSETITDGATFILHYPIIIQQKIAKNEENFIVDDEPNIVMALEYTFKRTILKFYSTRRPRGDILKVQLGCDYLDVMMPMVDGFATLEQIKDERLRHCKVIPFGKKTKKNTLKRTFIRCNLYVVKPFRQKISRTSTGFNSIRKQIQHHEIRGNLYPKHRPTRSILGSTGR
jgi:response regulator RpfG family c-di-GMP phosphodiesterase